MEILVTGGFGNVGRSAVKACIAAGHNVTILESPQAMAKADAGLRKMLRSPWRDCRVLFGDLRKPDNVRKALSSFGKGPDALIHLAALIPPAADQDEAKTWEVNAGGTKNLIEACLSLPKPPRFVLASSIATMGTGSKNFWIRVDDELKPPEIYQPDQGRMRRPGHGVGTRAYDPAPILCRLGQMAPLRSHALRHAPRNPSGGRSHRRRGPSFRRRRRAFPRRGQDPQHRRRPALPHILQGLSGQNIPLLRPWRLLIPAHGGLCGLRLPLRLVRRLGSSRGTAAFQKKNPGGLLRGSTLGDQTHRSLRDLNRPGGPTMAYREKPLYQRQA